MYRFVIFTALLNLVSQKTKYFGINLKFLNPRGCGITRANNWMATVLVTVIRKQTITAKWQENCANLRALLLWNNSIVTKGQWFREIYIERQKSGWGENTQLLNHYEIVKMTCGLLKCSRQKSSCCKKNYLIYFHPQVNN